MPANHWLLRKYGTRFDEGDAKTVEHQRGHDAESKNIPLEDTGEMTTPTATAMRHPKPTDDKVDALIMRKHGIASNN